MLPEVPIGLDIFAGSSFFGALDGEVAVETFDFL
jgi:hypothetical protein